MGNMQAIQSQLQVGVLGMASWLLLMPCAVFGQAKYAVFESGKDVVVLQTNVGPAGATLVVNKPGSPVDGIKVEIPEGALPETIAVCLYYNTGNFKPASGTASGVILGISAGKLGQFKKLVKIQVRYDAKLYSKSAVVGFSIDPDGSGRVSGFQLLSQDIKAGTATFGTLVPVRFTWVYAPTQQR